MNYFFWWLLEPISFFVFFSVILFLSWKVNHQIRFKVLAIYFLFTLAVSVKIVFTLDNSFLYSVMYLLTGVGLGYYFFLLFEIRLKKGIALVTSISTIVYYLYMHLIVGGESLFPSMGFVITSLEVIILIFLYFHQLMTNIKEDSLLSSVDFWFICSQVIYHLGAFGIFLTYNHLTAKIVVEENYSYENRSLLADLWGAHNILLFVSSLIIWYGVLRIFYQTKSNSRNQMHPLRIFSKK